MKTVLYLLCLLSLFATCGKEDWSIPESPCTLDMPDSSRNNPKDREYRRVLDYYVSRGIPGLVLLVRTPADGLWIGAAGKSKIETGEAMLPCQVHHSASVVKMYIGTSIMLLAEDKKIDLDAPINKYLDAGMCNHISNGNTATVRQLLNHTSGIRDFVTETKHLTDYFNNFFNHYTTDDFLHYIYGKPADFEAGTKAAYCNTNYVLLSLIIDRVTGKPHADFLSERIFKKLNLQQTFYKNEPGYPHPAGLVNSYWDRYGNGQLENITKVAIHFDDLSVGHDAMLATARDYARFLEALLKGQLVSPASLNQMKEWKYHEGEKGYSGLGLLKMETKYGDAIGHGGANFGVAMMARYYPQQDVTIVFCSNIAGFFPSPALDEVIAFSKGIEKTVFEE